MSRLPRVLAAVSQDGGNSDTFHPRGGWPAAQGHPGSSRGHGIQGLVPEGADSLSLSILSAPHLSPTCTLFGREKKEAGKIV